MTFVVNLPADHISTLIDVGDTEEEAFNTSEALSKVTLWIISIVQIFSHYY